MTARGALRRLWRWLEHPVDARWLWLVLALTVVLLAAMVAAGQI